MVKRVMLNETKDSNEYKSQAPETQRRADGESCQAHTGCWVCGWRVFLQQGLGGEAELLLCHSWTGMVRYRVEFINGI